MRNLARYYMAALFLATLFLLRADNPAAPHAPTTISEPTVFTYQIPRGWISVEVPHMYPIAVEASGSAKKEQAKAMISVTTRMDNSPLANWCAQSLQQNKAQLATLGAQVGQLEPFFTAASAIGYRAPIDLQVKDRALHYVMYFFDGGDGTKITVTCACPATDTPRYLPVFETAMKSFVPH